MRDLLAELYEHIVALDALINRQSKALQAIAKEREVLPTVDGDARRWIPHCHDPFDRGREAE